MENLALGTQVVDQLGRKGFVSAFEDETTAQVSYWDDTLQDVTVVRSVAKAQLEPCTAVPQAKVAAKMSRRPGPQFYKGGFT